MNYSEIGFHSLELVYFFYEHDAFIIFFFKLQVSVGYLDQRVSVVMPACQDFQAPWDLKVPRDLRVLKERGEKLGKEFRANKATPESQVYTTP